MENLFKVIIRYNDQYGLIEYNPATKKASVAFPDANKRCEIIDYLTTEKTINAAQQHLLDFAEVKIIPGDNVDNFKLALTRMWENIGVYVDWSRPVV